MGPPVVPPELEPLEAALPLPEPVRPELPLVPVDAPVEP